MSATFPTLELPHRHEFRAGRWIHLAACWCWREPAPPVDGCRYCRGDHAGGPCRWARWLRRVV